MKQTPPPSDQDPLIRALRAGPRPVRLPTGFHQRVENAWRHAPAEPARNFSGQLAMFWQALAGPVVAMATLALVVVWLTFAPGMPPPRAPEIAHENAPAPNWEEGFDATAVDRSTQGAALLAAMGSRLEDPYAEEARLLLEDATRALRYAAGQFLTPEMLALAERQGLPLEGLLREG
jgi:hypothetical protein